MRKKRLLSWLLSASMTLSLAPNMVFTAGAVDNAWPETNFTGEATVTLSENMTGAAPVTVGDGAVLTIEGKGHSITDFNGTLFTVENGGKLVLDDVTISGGANCDNGAVLVKNGGLLDLGYNDRKVRKAPSITGSTAKNLVVEENATVRLNAEATKRIGVSYAGDINQTGPKSLMVGGRYAIQSSDMAAEKISLDNAADLELVLKNDNIVVHPKKAKVLYWYPTNSWAWCYSSDGNRYDYQVLQAYEPGNKDIFSDAGAETTKLIGSQTNRVSFIGSDVGALEKYDFIYITPGVASGSQTVGAYTEEEAQALLNYLDKGGRIFIQAEDGQFTELNPQATALAQKLNAGFTINRGIQETVPATNNQNSPLTNGVAQSWSVYWCSEITTEKTEGVTPVFYAHGNIGTVPFCMDITAGSAVGSIPWGNVTVIADGNLWKQNRDVVGKPFASALINSTVENRITAATGVNPNQKVEIEATIDRTNYSSTSAALAKVTETGTVVVDSAKANSGKLTSVTNELFFNGAKLTTNGKTYTSSADGTHIDMDEHGKLTVRSGNVTLEPDAPINVKVDDSHNYAVKTSNGATVHMPENNTPYVILQGGESVTIDGVTYTVKDGESNVKVLIPNGFLNDNGSVNDKIAKADIADGKTAPVVIGKNEDGSFKTITATGAATITPDAPNAGDFSTKAKENTEITLPNGVKATVNNADCPTVWPADGQNPYVDVANQGTKTTVKNGDVTYVVDANKSAKVYLPKGMTDENVSKAIIDDAKNAEVDLGNGKTAQTTGPAVIERTENGTEVKAPANTDVVVKNGNDATTQTVKSDDANAAVVMPKDPTKPTYVTNVADGKVVEANGVKFYPNSETVQTPLPNGLDGEGVNKAEISEGNKTHFNGKDVTADKGTITIDKTTSDKPFINVPNGGQVSIGTDKIKADSQDIKLYPKDDTIKAEIPKDGKLTVNGKEFTAKDADTVVTLPDTLDSGKVNIPAGGSVSVNDKTITAVGGAVDVSKDGNAAKVELPKNTTATIGNDTIKTGANNQGGNIIVKQPDGEEKTTITVPKKGDTFTWNGKEYVAEKDGQVFVVGADGNVEAFEPKVIGKTSDSLTFEGKPGKNYVITKNGTAVTGATITENPAGVYQVTGLEKDTEYKISHPQYGYTTAKTSQASAEEIKNAFTPSENVEVGKDENGNYKITLKGDVEGAVLVPDTWGDVTLDMNGHNINGKNADENAAAQPGIKFTHATNGAGTKLNVVGQGTIKGGDGSAKHPNGAEGITAEKTAINAELTINKDVTVKGGNGVAAENGNGGNGGSGIAGTVKPNVNGGTVAGGNGAAGKDGESGTTGGNGGSGIKVDKDVAVNNGTVTGGNGGQGGAASGKGEAGGNGGQGGSGIDKDAAGNGTINIGTGSNVTGGNGGQGGAADTGNGGNGGMGGSGTNNTTEADKNTGTVTGGNGGNGGMSDKGENGNGGGAGQGGNGGTAGSTGGPGEQPNYGTLSASTSAITVANPKVGLTYKLYDAEGKEVASAKGEADKPLTFNGLQSGAEYTVKVTLTSNREVEVGKITTQRRSSGGGASGGGAAESFTITATAGDGGTITPNGKVSVSKNANKSFAIKANKEYEIKDVFVDGKSVGAKSSYTFEKVTQAHTISVSFKKIIEEPITEVADPKVTGVADTLETEKHDAYMNGKGNGKFAPDASMTRAEAAQMFYNLLQNKTADQNVKFTDVAATAWYSNAVSTLAARGVINGVGDNKFAPEKTISRAEFTAIAVRLAKSNAAADTKFADVSANAWYSGAVRTAISYGWITGYSDNTFRPNNRITRAEVVTVVNRMLARSCDKTSADSESIKNFSDVTKTHWAFYNIAEAANAHNYTKDNGVENWNGLK